jgi:hypothetical protein
MLSSAGRVALQLRRGPPADFCAISYTTQKSERPYAQAGAALTTFLTAALMAWVAFCIKTNTLIYD